MELIEKPVIQKYIKNEYGEFEVHDLLETLEELENTGSFGNRLVMYDSAMKRWFEKIDLIEISTKGSVYVNDEKVRNNLYREVYKLVNGEYPDEE